jgi:hypothetical protein
VNAQDTRAASREPSAWTYRGIAFASYQDDVYLSDASAQSLQELRASGANWVSILATWYMPTPTATTLQPDTDKSPSDDALRKAIADAHASGLKVLLQPRVDVADGSWRGQIAPADTALWFDSYRAFLVHYAVIAQASGCEMLCTGSELKSMSGENNLPAWSATLVAIRAAYSGPLTYAANASFPNDEFSSLSFWSQLDVAGLDVYAPLTSGLSPSQADLVGAWSSNRFGFDIKGRFADFADQVGKPVIFTGIGYESSDGTNVEPYGVVNGTLDLQEQADCYSAAFSAFADADWLSGMFWWGWEARAIDPATDVHYSPRGKPAGDVLSAQYGGINRLPRTGSGILITPNDPDPGVAVQFSVDASDADGDPLSYAWDFGNGITSTDATPTMTFTSGVYAVTLELRDGHGVPVTRQRLVRVFATEQALDVQRCTVSMNFTRANSDSISVRGALPGDPLPAFGGAVYINVGGFESTLQIDDRGRAMSDDKTVKFKLSKRARNGAATFSFSVRHADLRTALSDEGLTGAIDAKKQARMLRVEVGTATGYFTTSLTLEYTAKAGKRGRAKSRR